MSESAIETSGPSLEQILWRAFDRFEERPALTDAEEFADHIATATAMPSFAELWAEKFLQGPEKMHRRPADVADAIVAATSKRLHVYEFDLGRLEYVVLEEKEKIVVVSDRGQFTASNNDVVTRAIEAAVIPDGGRRDHGGTEPRAYFVRADGKIAALDVRKLAGVLQTLAVRQVSAPAVDLVAKRMLPFAPLRRVSLDPARESRVLRQDRRARETLRPPALKTERGGPPATAQNAVLVVLPDGRVARPEIGSASRWREMLSLWAARASATGATPEPVSSRVTVQAGGIVAQQEVRGLPGELGERALRFAPVMTLDEDALQQALARGALVVPGRAEANRFWIQPEAAFKPDAGALAQGRPGAGAMVIPGWAEANRFGIQPEAAFKPDAGALAQGRPGAGALVRPLQLGEITGDPWADWALLGGGVAPPMTALRGRSLPPALDQPDAMSMAPLLAQRLRAMRPSELQMVGGRVVAFRDAGGTLIVQPQGAVRLAAVGRERPDSVRRAIAELAPRAGALPATALATLQMALERTAGAGGYKLPVLRLASAPDALGVGSAMELAVSDPRRTAVRLAGPSSLSEGPSGQVARLVLSMPFPNQGELHVGGDLSEALQAYLGGPVQPARVPLAGAAFGGAMFRLRAGQQSPLSSDAPTLDWSALNAQATQRAQDAVITLDLPSVQRLVAGSSSVSGLPALLQRALAQSGDWTPGPGAPMPLAIRELALKGPFEDLPGDLVGGAPAQAPRRPINPGEDEIVIPLPLWAQMGRGRLSATDQIMASPLAPNGYAPPLGTYRLIAPYGQALDHTAGGAAGTPGLVQLAGPTGLELVAPGGSGVSARSTGGRYLLGTVALDDGETVVGRRGRVLIGQPLGGPEARAPIGAAQQSLSTGVTQLPSIDTGNLPALSGALGSAGQSSRPMAGALQSAIRMSGDVESRALPGRPSFSSGGSSAGSTFGDGSSSGFAARAAAAGRADAAGGLPSLSGQQTLVSGSSQGGVFQAELSQGASDSGAAAAETGSTADSASQRMSAGDGGSFIVGLPPGAWSGARRGDPGYMSWSYGPSRSRAQQESGGVDISGLARPQYPSLPGSLRFRYVGAPLWWSGAGGGRDSSTDDADSQPATRAMRSGLRAATSAASIWKSIFLASPEGSGGAVDDTAGMGADAMSGLSGRFDALGAARLATGGAVAGAGAETIYVAMDRSGAAGTTTGKAAAQARARADAIEMSIVAAIPPQPPPLESMGSEAGEVAHARGKGGVGPGDHHHGNDKEESDRTSQSKIEGSVDAIAQRIYHRIRRRIQNDRERFGG